MSIHRPRNGHVLVECIVALSLLVAMVAVLQLIINTLTGGLSRALERDSALLVADRERNKWIASACSSLPAKLLPATPTPAGITLSVTAQAQDIERYLNLDLSWNERIVAPNAQPINLNAARLWTHSVTTKVICD